MHKKAPDHADVPPTSTCEDAMSLPPRSDDYFRVERRPDTNEVSEIHHGDVGVVTSTRVEDDGTAQYSVAGPAPRNEAGADVVASILARRKSRDGGIWTADPTKPTGPERGADWVIRDANATGYDLQITRVVPRHVLASWGKTGRADVDIASIQDAVDDIKAAIEHKRHRADGTTTLVLDARHPNFHALPQVVAAFRASPECEWLRDQVRYPEVWIVGLTDDLTFQLK